MGVGQLAGDVHLEVVVVGDDRVPQVHHGGPLVLIGLRSTTHYREHHTPTHPPSYTVLRQRSGALYLAQQNRFQSRVQLLPHVLQQAGLPEADGVLQAAQEVPVTELHDVQSILPFLGCMSRKHA